jgi:hypothetical protein
MYGITPALARRFGARGAIFGDQLMVARAPGPVQQIFRCGD